MKHGSKMKVYDPYSNWNIRLTVVHKSEAGEFWRLQSNQKYKDIKYTHLEIFTQVHILKNSKIKICRQECSYVCQQVAITTQRPPCKECSNTQELCSLFGGRMFNFTMQNDLIHSYDLIHSWGGCGVALWSKQKTSKYRSWFILAGNIEQLTV